MKTALLSLLVSSVLASSPVVAGTIVFTVDTDVDAVDDDVTDGVCHTAEGACSLRAAIMQNNHVDAAHVDIFVPAGLYTLTRAMQPGDDPQTTGDLDITNTAAQPHELVIHGSDVAPTIIDGNGTDRVFFIYPGASVILLQLTIQHGAPQPDSVGGGGIVNFGHLVMEGCVVTANVSPTSGGGITTTASSNLTINHSTISANRALTGGGLYAFGAAYVRNSLLSTNAADNGGGAYIEGVNGKLFAVNSTFSGNTANENGGGIANFANAFLYNVSIVNNDADHDRDEQGGVGGGVYASPTGAGPTRFLVTNALIANNTIFDAPIADNCNGALEDYGLNLMDDRLGCTVTSDPSLGFVDVASIGPLQDNGGPTPSHALLVGSAAIDSTLDVLGCVDEGGAPLPFDQRGAPRPAGLRCDVGAFEFGAEVPVDDRVFRDGFDGEP